MLFYLQCTCIFKLCLLTFIDLLIDLIFGLLFIHFVYFYLEFFCFCFLFFFLKMSSYIFCLFYEGHLKVSFGQGDTCVFMSFSVWCKFLRLIIVLRLNIKKSSRLLCTLPHFTAYVYFILWFGWLCVVKFENKRKNYK